ncbi:unnamed protein product [Euphydryas editha]|uniref:Uncharacterized protein n=1 Tax=Euphydryas editha TaxID=104508 RepID=A0AAU9TPS1_EUPED|nr:unnamed protein product [Euphydryas editha]
MHMFRKNALTVSACLKHFFTANRLLITPDIVYLVVKVDARKYLRWSLRWIRDPWWSSAGAGCAPAVPSRACDAERSPPAPPPALPCARPCCASENTSVYCEDSVCKMDLSMPKFGVVEYESDDSFDEEIELEDLYLS